MKKLDLFDKKNPFEKFTADEVNQILDAIGVAYDSGLSSDQTQRKIALDWKVISETSFELFEIKFSTPIRLNDFPLNVLINYSIPEGWNGREVVFNISENNQMMNLTIYDSDKNNCFVYTKIPAKGFFDIDIKINTGNNICFIKNINWGW